MRCIKRIEMEDGHRVDVLLDYPGDYKFAVGAFQIGIAKRTHGRHLVDQHGGNHVELAQCAKSLYARYLQEHKA